MKTTVFVSFVRHRFFLLNLDEKGGTLLDEKCRRFPEIWFASFVTSM